MYPLSLGQQGLWLLDRLDPGSNAYNDGVSIRVTGPIDRIAFTTAIARLVERHQVLRTTISLADGRPYQKVGPVPGPSELVQYVEWLGGLDRVAAAKQFAEKQLGRPFDLGNGPLFRAYVLSLDDNDHVIVLGLHHIISDGWSLHILLEELSALYETALAGEAVVLPELAIQYGDFAVRQREQLGPEALREQLDYWRAQLAEVPPPLAAEAAPGIGHVHIFRIPGHVGSALRQLSRDSGTSMFMTLMVGYQALLAQIAERDDLFLGVPSAGRSDPDTVGLIGYFVNLLVFRSDTAGAPTIKELLSRIRATTLGNLAHQDMPFESLVEAINPKRSVGMHPLVQVTFQYLADEFATSVELPGCIAEEFEVRGRRTPFLLSMDVLARGDELTCSLTYSDAVLGGSEVADLARDFIALLGAMADDPLQRTTELPQTGVRLRGGSQPVAELRGDVQYTAPRPGIEELVGELMAAALGLQRLGRDDDFFERGGHSLPAVLLVAQIREVFGVGVSVKTLFEQPTLAGFAELIRSQLYESRTVGAPLKPRGPGPVRASFAQERLWFIRELDAASTAYNMGGAFHIGGPISLEALRRALRQLTTRHEVLRTRFELVDGALLQQVEENWRGDLQVTGAAGPVDDQAVHAFLSEVLTRPYDLSAGPLFRAELLRIEPERHILVLGIHHVICDGWSLGVLLRELSQLYAANVKGVAALLPDLTAQYGDFAKWQREELAGPVLPRLLGYWRTQISGAPTTISWHGAKLGRSSAAPSEEQYAPFTLCAEQTAALRRMARDAGVTLFMALFAVFQVALARVSGQDDILIGVPVAGRSATETEGLVGLFVNLLAVRADMRGDPTFAQLLTRVRETMLSGLAHQDLPFERLVEEVSPERSATLHPLVQTLFELFEEDSATRLDLPGLHVDQIDALPGSRNPDIPLAFSARCTEGRVEGGVYFDSAVLGVEEMTRFAGFLTTVATLVPGAADVHTSELPLIAANEVEAVLALGEGPEAVRSVAPSIVEAFQEEVRAVPDHPAVSDADGTWTYFELSDAVDRIASAVALIGGRVAIGARRGREYVAALLGVLSAGATAVPLELADPPSRLRTFIEDSIVDALLLDADGAEALAGVDGRRVLIDDALRTAPRHARWSQVPESIAAIMFTSGSTGVPKGVLLERSAFANLLRAHRGTRFSGKSPRAVALTASFAVDASWDQMLWMMAGHHVWVVDEDTRRDSAALTAFVRDHRIDVLDVPQSQLSIMLDLGVLDAAGHRPSTLILGGEAVRPELWRRLHQESEIEVWNLYGPTECTVDALACRLTDSDEPLIGNPIEGTYVRLLDPGGGPVPPGVIGEIYLGGAHLARGYLGKPQLTADRFVPDPVGPVPGRRLYRTGDLGRYLPDGRVQFVGRADRQVKIRGYRVDMGEIEAVALTYPGVVRAAVTTRDRGDGSDLTLYLATTALTDQSTTALTGDVRSHLAGRLPAYMIPANIVAMAELPLLPSGKVDLQQLAQADVVVAPRQYSAPRSAIEDLLGQLMADVLGLERLGRDDDFFERGGHSLRAGRLVARVREVFGVRASVRALFDHPTVAGFAVVIGHLLRDSAPGAVPPVRGAPGPAAASFAQQRLWLMQELDPSSTLYHMGEAFEIVGPLDVAALRTAVSALAARHETLRTRLILRGSTLFQEVDDAWPGEITVVKPPGVVDEQLVSEFVSHVMERPYDLAMGPLFRAELLECEPERYILAVGFHHVICDGWSVTVFLSELEELYAAVVENRVTSLPLLPIQYSDFARWQRAQFKGDALSADLQYWLSHVDGAPMTLSWRRPTLRGNSGDTAAPFTFLIPGDRAAGLRGMAREAGATLFMVLFAVFQVALARVSGLDDMLIGVPTAGRSAVETEGLVGFFVNMLAIRADLRGNPTFAELLARVRESTLAGLAHQDLPFERLVAAVNPERHGDQHPLIQVTFQTFEEQGDLSPRLIGVRTRTIDARQRGSRYDLSLDVFSVEEGLRCWLYYDCGSFDIDSVASLGASFCTLVDDVLTDRGRAVSELSRSEHW